MNPEDLNLEIIRLVNDRALPISSRVKQTNSDTMRSDIESILEREELEDDSRYNNFTKRLLNRKLSMCSVIAWTFQIHWQI